MPTIIIERISHLVQQCENILPSIEEITNFEEQLMELNHLTFGKSSIDIIAENAKNFKGADTNNDISQFEHRKTEMAIHETKIKQLKNQLSILETQYEKKSREKETLEKVDELSINRDIILCYKMGTLSELSYNKKIKFGFLMNKKTLDYKTFGYEMDEDSPEMIEDRWSLLKSFVNPPES